ncbi:hypothetical protein [Bosea sp. FBZP-16]|uniref:hypothetical protein n=1 Tax=Bosea sp. FBZP-16 TaxID=2065382 RepID=UPI000C30C752|nr:hypothetical protein [Bosea sp. FBZP-16]
MNRRSLLRLIGLAPVAVPAIASAAPAAAASNHSVAYRRMVFGEWRQFAPAELETLRVYVGETIHLDLPVVAEGVGFQDGDGI